MERSVFDEFDPTPYQRVPLTNLANTVALAKALADGLPEDAGVRPQKRVARMLELVAKIEAERTRRRRSAEGSASYGVPQQFDGAEDALWVLFRDRLVGRGAYRHQGFDPLIDQPYTPLGASLQADRRAGERGAAIAQRLFGDAGLTILRGSYRDQFEATGTILRTIEAEGWVDELRELVGDSLMTQLFLMQEQYELMIIDQLRTEPEGENLRELRFALMRAIGRYTTSILDLLDEDRPETLEQVETALRPMIRVRALQAGTASNTDAAVSEAPTPGASPIAS